MDGTRDPSPLACHKTDGTLAVSLSHQWLSHASNILSLTRIMLFMGSAWPNPLITLGYALRSSSAGELEPPLFPESCSITFSLALRTGPPRLICTFTLPV